MRCRKAARCLKPTRARFVQEKGKTSMKYDLSQIMKKAWEIFRKVKITFAEALHRAWLSAKALEINQKRIESAKATAKVTEEINTWAEWRKLGYEVIE